MTEHSAPLPAIPPETQAVIDREHLRMLEIVYYIAGGVTAFFSTFLIIHFTMFLMFGLNPKMFVNTAHGQQTAPPPAGMFLGGAAIVAVLILIGWTFGALQIYAGRCLRRRRARTFVLVIAALECVFIPWGTAIGVFTIIALTRASIQSLFSRT